MNKATENNTRGLVTKENIFFGIINEDGTRSSLVHHFTPTPMQLQTLGKHYPDHFTTRCECGESALVYSHTISTEEKNILVSRIHYCCPKCGKNGTKGANWHLAKMRINILNNSETVMYDMQS